MRRTCILTALVCALSAAQVPREPGRTSREDDSPIKPSQVNEMLRDDHKKSVEEAGRLLELAEELKIELEKNSPNVLSLAAVKKAEEIEKLAKRIKSRMKRY
jgi:hypothetical protein